MSSQDYREMIEIPVSSCQMVNSTPKKAAKKRLLARFNKMFLSKQKKEDLSDDKDAALNYQQNEKKDEKTERQNEYFEAYTFNSQTLNADQSENKESFGEYDKESNQKAKKPFKWDIIKAQMVTAAVLLVGIVITNIFWQDSGINNLFRKVFAVETNNYDERTYDLFSPSSPSKNQVDIEEGVISVPSGAIYSPCDGFIESVQFSSGKYTVTISHSDLFKSVICGVDYCYFNEGDKVYTSTPVCYALGEGAEVTMYNDGKILTAFDLNDQKIVWQD